MKAGVACPACGGRASKAYESGTTRRAIIGKIVWRRRRCEGCQSKFTTFESTLDPGIVFEAMAVVTKGLEKAKRRTRTADSGHKFEAKTFTPKPVKQRPVGATRYADFMKSLREVVHEETE